MGKKGKYVKKMPYKHISTKMSKPQNLTFKNY